MKLTLVQTAAFVTNWNRLGLTDDDLRALETLVMEHPEAGKVIRGTGGLRKIRFAPPSWNTGKSGATRVCYAHFATVDAAYFLAVYPKNVQDNLTARQKAVFKKLVEAIGSGMRKV